MIKFKFTPEEIFENITTVGEGGFSNTIDIGYLANGELEFIRNVNPPEDMQDPLEDWTENKEYMLGIIGEYIDDIEREYDLIIKELDIKEKGKFSNLYTIGSSYQASSVIKILFDQNLSDEEITEMVNYNHGYTGNEAYTVDEVKNLIDQGFLQKIDNLLIEYVDGSGAEYDKNEIKEIVDHLYEFRHDKQSNLVDIEAKKKPSFSLKDTQKKHLDKQDPQEEKAQQKEKKPSLN